MEQIPLTKGKFALVDDDDFKELSKYKWCFSGEYPSRRKDNKIMLMHRYIMKAKKGEYVDHINGNKLDNMRCNLRICTNAENSRNCKLSKNNKSGYKGVHWYKNYKKWAAAIKYNYKSIKLGYFINKIDAAKAYNEAAIKYHGEFANLNKI